MVSTSHRVDPGEEALGKDEGTIRQDGVTLGSLADRFEPINVTRSHRVGDDQRTGKWWLPSDSADVGHQGVTAGPCLLAFVARSLLVMATMVRKKLRFSKVSFAPAQPVDTPQDSQRANSWFRLPTTCQPAGIPRNMAISVFKDSSYSLST